jgi:glycosyltransferase involved in cell wall biosynthesis
MPANIEHMVSISVITAVYNRRGTVGEALESLLAQTHAKIEPIVIDGGSTDGTLEVVDRFRDRLSVVVSEHDGGVYDALNKGIARATGDVVGFLHADDVYATPHALAAIAAAFDDPTIDAVYGDLVYVRADNIDHVVRYWRAGTFEHGLLSRGWMPPHPTLYVRRKVYEQWGGFDCRFRIAADYESVLRLFGRAGIRAVYVPEVLVRMRVGGLSNGSLPALWQKSKEDLQAVRETGVGGLGTVVRKNLGKVGQFWRRT